MKDTFTISLLMFVLIQSKNNNAEIKNKTAEIHSIFRDCKGDSCSVLDIDANIHNFKETGSPYESLRRSGTQGSGSIIEEDEIIPIEYMVEKVSEIKTKNIITVAKKVKKAIKRLTKTGKKHVSQALQFNPATAQTLGRKTDPLASKTYAARLIKRTIQLALKVAGQIFDSLSSLLLRSGRNIKDMIMIYAENIDNYGIKQTEKIRIMKVTENKDNAKREAYIVEDRLSSISKKCEINIKKLLTVINYNIKKCVQVGTVRIAGLGEFSEHLLEDIAKHFPTLFQNLLLNSNDNSVIAELTNDWSRDLQEVVDECFMPLAKPVNEASRMISELTKNRIAAVTALAGDDLEKSKYAEELSKSTFVALEVYTDKLYTELEEYHITKGAEYFLSKVLNRTRTDLLPILSELPGYSK